MPRPQVAHRLSYLTSSSLLYYPQIKDKGSPIGDPFIILIKLTPYINSGANTNEITVISLIKILIDGPLVSLKGSPTVSPLTAAA